MSHMFKKKQELGCDLVHVRMGIDFEMSVMFPLKGGGWEIELHLPP